MLSRREAATSDGAGVSFEARLRLKGVQKGHVDQDAALDQGVGGAFPSGRDEEVGHLLSSHEREWKELSFQAVL